MIERVGYLISSCAGYERPLDRLLASMATIPADQILVVVGGCAHDDLSTGDRGVRRMRVRHNSYDYTALIGWLEHPQAWQAPDHLFLLHDTCELGPDADRLIRNADPALPATAVWGGQCNLLLLRADYARACAPQIRALRDCTKRQAIAAEGFLWRQLRPESRGAYPGQIEVAGVARPYDGAERLVERYTGVDLIKHKANWGQTSQTGRFVVTP